MQTIAELPDEPQFTIKQVGEQTGIRAVTLRAWERRYEVLTPRRAGNRYRLYSERDIALLRWIKDRVDHGTSISSVASELHNMIKQGFWPDALPNAPTTQPNARPGIPTELYSRQLYEALIHHNENKASDLLGEAHSIFDLPTILTRVIVPSLVEIGEAWYRGDIRITTEHFASSFIRGRLLALFQSYPSRHSADFVMVGCAPTEFHEIGSLMLAVLLRSSGLNVEYLGPNVPLDDLADYARYEHPKMIVLSASMLEAAQELQKAGKIFDRLRPRPIFAYGGAAFSLDPNLKTTVQGVFLGDDLVVAQKNVLEMLQQVKTTVNR